MAKIRDYAVTVYSADTASAVCTMPLHETGDLLLAFAGKDGTPAINTPANWSNQASGASTGAYGGIYSRRAQSSSEEVTFTTTATVDAWYIIIVSIQGAAGTATDGSDSFSGSASLGTTDNSSPYGGGSITPTHNNCLILGGLFTDATFGVQPVPGWTLVNSGDSGTNSVGLCYTVQKTAAAISGPNWYSGTGAVDDTRSMIIAVRDSGSLTYLNGYLDRGTTPAYLLGVLTGSATGDVNSIAYIAAASATLTSVQVNGSTSKTSTGLTISSTADSGYNPYRSTATTAGSSSTTNLGHSEITCSWDCTQGLGLVFGMWRYTIPRDYLDMGAPKNGGAFVNFTSGTTANARAWLVGGQFCDTTKVAGYNPFVIQVQQSSNSAYAWNGTVTWSSVARVSFGSSSYYAASSTQWQSFYCLNKAVLAGGTTTTPIDLNSIKTIINNSCGFIPLVSQTGSAIQSFIPIQVGGGDNCVVSVDLSSIQFPTKADGSNYLDFHVDNDVVGIEFYGTGSSDSFTFTNTVFTSASSYYWKFNSSHNSGTVINFSGSSVINALVTLVSSVQLTGVSFINCTEVSALNSLTNCTFNKSRGTSGAVLVTGSSESALQTALNYLSNCTFSSNTTPSGALRLSYTGSASNIVLNITSGTFSGNTADIRWEAPSSSNLTLNISGTCNLTSSSTYSATNSNTVTFIAGSVSATVTCQTVAGSPIEAAKVLLTTNTGATLPYRVTVTITNSGTTATVSHTSHLMNTGDKVLIKGASHEANNGVFTITKINADSYSYTMGATPGSNPTGSITATFVFIYGDTNASGITPTFTRVIPADQPATGWARKSSGAPYYKTAPISGTVDSVTGGAFTALLIEDT
jgi:hypothetical protein